MTFLFLFTSHRGFPSFQADDVTKVEPTKVHLVLHIYLIQGFISDGLYRMIKVMYLDYIPC